MRWLQVMAEVLVMGVTRCFDAAVSMNAVDDKSGGLVQPEVWINDFAKLLATSSFESSAGVHRQVGAQVLLILLPPFVSARVALAS